MVRNRFDEERTALVAVRQKPEPEIDTLSQAPDRAPCASGRSSKTDATTPPSACSSPSQPKSNSICHGEKSNAQICNPPENAFARRSCERSASGTLQPFRPECA